MSNKIKIFLILVIVVILIFSFFINQRQKDSEREEVVVTIYNEVYQQGSNPQLKIENYLGASICFSSNFPYYVEKKVGEEWKEYKYLGPKGEDFISKCMSPRDVKAFELISPIRKGLHKIAIPVCLDCEVGQKFEENKRFYSGQFIIK